jgi:hypothetical protein
MKMKAKTVGSPPEPQDDQGTLRDRRWIYSRRAPRQDRGRLSLGLPRNEVHLREQIAVISTEYGRAPTTLLLEGQHDGR